MHNYLLWWLTSRPSLFFRPNRIFIARHLRHLFVFGFVKNTLTTVINMIRNQNYIHSPHIQIYCQRGYPQGLALRGKGGNDDRN